MSDSLSENLQRSKCRASVFELYDKLPEKKQKIFGQMIRNFAEKKMERDGDEFYVTKIAEQLFFDLKQFMYLCGTRPGISSPTPKIDDGWHEFVLYTEEYGAFCNSMFGRMVHHAPAPYLSQTPRLKGKMWATYQAALAVFGDLSENWEVPENRRPNITAGLEGIEATDPCNNGGNGCGCSACAD